MTRQTLWDDIIPEAQTGDNLFRFSHLEDSITFYKPFVILCVYCNPGVGWRCLLYRFIKHCDKPNGNRPHSVALHQRPPLPPRLPGFPLPTRPHSLQGSHKSAVKLCRNQTTSISQPALSCCSVCFQMSARWNISPNQCFNLLAGIYSTLLNILYYTKLHGGERKSESSLCSLETSQYFLLAEVIALLGYY